MSASNGLQGLTTSLKAYKTSTSLSSSPAPPSLMDNAHSKENSSAAGNMMTVGKLFTMKYGRWLKVLPNTMGSTMTKPLPCYDIWLLTQFLFITQCITTARSHDWDTFLLFSLFRSLFYCPYSGPIVHLFLDGPLLLRTTFLLFSDDASPGRVIHYAFLLTHTMTCP